MAKLYLDSHHRLSRYILEKRAGEQPDRSILKQIRAGLTEVLEMMKDPNHPELTGDNGGFVSPIEKTLQYLQFEGRLVYGPGEFSYVDHLLNTQQVFLTSQECEGFVSGANLPLGPKSSGEVIWRFEADDQCVFKMPIILQSLDDLSITVVGLHHEVSMRVDATSPHPLS